MAVQRALMLLLMATILVFGTGSVHAALIDQQRTMFLDAEAALERGEMREFLRLRDRLHGYPLFPYLEFEALKKRLDKASPSEVRAFLQRYADIPLAGRLRASWLNQLAKQRRWTVYLSFYVPTSNISRRCHRLHALIATGRTAEALPKAGKIWMHGRSRPTACDPVFKAWSKAGLRTPAKNWQRIELAMSAGQWRLAEYLGRGFSNKDKVWLKRWVRLYRNPRHLTEFDRYREAHPYRGAMLSQAVRRLARWDGEEALKHWRTLRARFKFSGEQVRRTEQYILRNLVRVPGDAAYGFIAGVEVGDDDLPAHEARIRSALLRQDWPRVTAWIDALPMEERKAEKWRYWRARALFGQGDRQAATKLFRELAGERSYYGFLSADRVGADYHLLHAETPACQRNLDLVAALPAFHRARELFILERLTDARREWRDATRNMSKGQLKAAAKLAKTEGWHDRAIFTLARTGYWDDLELRFPLQHSELVEQYARRYGIDEAWVFAVMRQESAFMQNARSSAGAMGLMQLMPATARNVARKVMKREPPKRRKLFEPDTNIALGSAYLKQMKEELGDSEVLATAAYNAGPQRVTRWLPSKTLPADIWIELVPFKETRGYLQRVLSYIVIYEKRMGVTPTRLDQRLHPVPPKLGLVSQSSTSPGHKS